MPLGGGAGSVVDELAGWVERLAGVPAASGDPERVDRIAVLERLRGAVAAAQARETVEFARSQVAAQAAAGVPASRRGRGVAEQIGFARRISPAWAARQLGLAQAWHTDLPAVFMLLRRGEISEWSAQIVAKQTRELSPDVRRAVVAELAPELPGLSRVRWRWRPGDWPTRRTPAPCWRERGRPGLIVA